MCAVASPRAPTCATTASGGPTRVASSRLVGAAITRRSSAWAGGLRRCLVSGDLAAYLVADAFTLSDEALLREVETSAGMTRVRR